MFMDFSDWDWKIFVLYFFLKNLIEMLDIWLIIGKICIFIKWKKCFKLFIIREIIFKDIVEF